MDIIKEENIKSILISQPAFLGDSIMATTLAAALRKTFPNARVDMLCIPATKAIWKNNPNIDNIHIFDKKSGMLKKATEIFRIINILKEEHYSCVFALQGSWTSRYILKSANIPIRIGYYKHKGLTHGVSYKKNMHVRERRLSLMRVFTNEKFDDSTQLFWDENIEKQAINKAEAYHQLGKYLIGMAPGSVWQTKCWPEEYWVELIDRLAKYNVLPVLFGGKAEVELSNRIEKQTKARLINTTGKFTIPESAAMIDKLDLMITNDSGPLHIANAVDTPVFAFFGPTVKRFGFYPYREKDKMLEIELACRPCHSHGLNKCPEGHFKCMLEQKPYMIEEEIRLFLDGLGE